MVQGIARWATSFQLHLPFHPPAPNADSAKARQAPAPRVKRASCRRGTALPGARALWADAVSSFFISPGDLTL